ncbi:MAG: hypothetical protein HY755_11735 [Nitrospirae bacterium]|nr:hypothetical protein [Nitrospirota bacterium]
MVNKVVAKKRDGTLIKGTTSDFLPNKNIFNVHSRGYGTYNISKVIVNELKAVFFVKKLEGNKASHSMPKKNIKPRQHTIGRHIKVFFQDGEVIDGLSHSLHLDRLGFFMTPADTTTNNERIFVVISSIEKIMVDDQIITFPVEQKIGKVCHICGNDIDPEWKYCPFDGTLMS